MAIADVKEYAHLTEEEVDQLGRELDAIRAEIEESRGAADAAYINRMIRIQRGLAAAGRVTLMAGTQFDKTRKPAIGAGIGMPYGCRMGICHTCTLTLISGKVRDLRNGDEYDNANEPVQTCCTAAVGDCTLDI